MVGGAGNDDVERGRALDHVVVRQYLSRRGQHDPRAGCSAAGVGELRVDDDHPVADRRRAGARECQARAHAEGRQSDDRDEDQAHAQAAKHSCEAGSYGRLSFHDAPWSGSLGVVYVRCAGPRCERVETTLGAL